MRPLKKKSVSFPTKLNKYYYVIIFNVRFEDDVIISR